MKAGNVDATGRDNDKKRIGSVITKTGNADATGHGNDQRPVDAGVIRTGHADGLRNIKLVLEYDGTRYCGFQRQKDLPTIQALSLIHI